MKNHFFIYVIGLFFVFMGCSESEIAKPQEKEKTKEELPIETEKYGFDASYTYYDNDTTLKSKLFYFLLAVEKDTKIEQGISSNPELNKIKEKYNKVFSDFLNGKYNELPEFGNALLLTSNEIVSVESTFDKLSDKGIFKSIIEKHIKPSGKYESYYSLEDKFIVKLIWRESIAKGINNIIKQYLIGEKPTYESDGLKYSLNSTEYKNLIKEQIGEMKSGNLFFSKIVDFTISLLEINNRNEAIRFEPLSSENAKAITNISKIKWSDYQYSSILLLGDSPNSPGDDVKISESAKQRIEYAVKAFGEKLAPIIIITGANIYPYQTPYFEAVEMKKWMMDKYNIKEENIIIEPCARHTTTNLRNGSRLIFKYKIPNKQKSLIITTKKQNDIITEAKFKQRCIKELGYMPIELGERLTNERLEFIPLVESMHTNSIDPLDP